MSLPAAQCHKGHAVTAAVKLYRQVASILQDFQLSQIIQFCFWQFSCRLLFCFTLWHPQFERAGFKSKQNEWQHRIKVIHSRCHFQFILSKNFKHCYNFQFHKKLNQGVLPVQVIRLLRYNIALLQVNGNCNSDRESKEESHQCTLIPNVGYSFKERKLVQFFLS